MEQHLETNDELANNHRFVFQHRKLSAISETHIAQHIANVPILDARAWQQIVPTSLQINQAVFQIQTTPRYQVSLLQEGQHLMLFCNCSFTGSQLCSHQALIMLSVLRKEDWAVFFDEQLRRTKITQIAKDYGLDNEPDLTAYFQLRYEHSQLYITPKIVGLTPVTNETLAQLKHQVFPVSPAIESSFTKDDTETSTAIILKRHKYDKHLLVELYQTAITKEGKPKPPFVKLDAINRIWNAINPDELRFFTAVSRFQQRPNVAFTASDLLALKAIVKNPLDFKFYVHLSEISDQIIANSLESVQISLLPTTFRLVIEQKDSFYFIGARVQLAEEEYSFHQLQVKMGCFVSAEKSVWYLISQLPVLQVIDWLRKKEGQLLVHQSKYKIFQTQLLATLGDSIPIDYAYIPPATKQQLSQNGFDQPEERIIYLSDLGQYVMVEPVMRYGEVEIPVRTKRQVYGVDNAGNPFLVARNDAAEIRFTALLMQQHPDFEEQIDNEFTYFYLHKKHFMAEEWFLHAFEVWRNQQITILGFNEIANNRLNPYKVSIQIKVVSGINWFDVQVGVRFGKKKASLKKLVVAARNKSKYVALDDGTVGILPVDWLEKFASYFEAGEIVNDESIHIPKINFKTVAQLFDAEMLDESVQAELSLYQQRLYNFKGIEPVAVPETLNGTLRSYQQEGLNWLNFLDGFGFGGCLADDMGLGKSIQIIAFMLLLKRKRAAETHLIVVPTTLIFNWQTELTKFAPSLSIHILYGAGRDKNSQSFSEYDVVITSYNTLLLDIAHLKKFVFGYVFLDESHQIKNPETQRYKAVCLLQSRNRIAISGTPMENNTFDLFGQFSFACPGLLGNKRYFKEVYAVPIDQFKIQKRAAELKERIRPFLLRRTKAQVATELPPKTEMILYCEMKPEQRKIYQAYEKEFREYVDAASSEEIKRSPMHVLKGLTKLRQLCNSTLLLANDAPAGEGTSAKIEVLLEQLTTNAANHKVLVFSQFVKMLHLIEIQLKQQQIGCLSLTGSTKNRQEVVETFQQDGDIQVLLISLKVGGTGLNLTEADYVYIVDPWWNPAAEEQAIDRVYRIGQEKKVTAIRLICPETVEEKIQLLQVGKKDLANHLVTAENDFFHSLSKADLLNLVGR